MAGVRQRKNETREEFQARRAQWWADKRERERAAREARWAQAQAQRDARREAQARGETYQTPTLRREVWDDWREFLSHCETTPEGRYATSHDASQDEWAEASWADSVSMSHEGWTADLPSIETFASHVADRVIDERLAESLEWRRDVSGQVVDIAAFLNGEPECMIEAMFQTTPAIGPLVRLIVPITAHAGVPTAKIRRRGAAVCALVTVLLRAGHTLEVWAGVSTEAFSGVGRHSCAVKVQDSRDPADMARIMYAIGHPGMLRRTMFAAMEHYPADLRETFRIRRGGGYGSPSPARPTDVPDVAGKTIILPEFNTGIEWTEQESIQWIEQTLDGLRD